MHDSAQRRSHRILGLAVLVAALFLGVAPAAQATWRTGHGSPPAWQDEHVCMDGIDWTFAWFPPVKTPNWAPPSTLQIAVSGPQGRLLTGVYEVPPDPLQLTPAEIVGGFETWIDWRRGKVGLFDRHATIRLAFPPGVQVPSGAQVTITEMGWLIESHYTVDNCTITAFPPPAP